MRRWLLLAVAVMALIGGSVTILLINLQRWADANRDWLMARAEAMLGRPVHLDAVGVSVVGGLGVRLGGLRIGEDAAYGSGDFLQAADVRVVVRLLPALFGRYQMRRVVLRNPLVTIVRDERGLNIDSLLHHQAQAHPEAHPTTTPAPNVAAAPPAPADGAANVVPALFIALLNVRNAEVHYVDRRRSPPAELALRKLDVTASDLSLTQAVRLDLAASLDGEDRDVELEGTIGPLGDPPDFERLPIDLHLVLASLDLQTVRAVPELAARFPPALEVVGPLAIEGIARGTRAEATVEVRFDARAAAVRWGAIFAKPTKVPLAIAITGRRVGDSVDVQRASLVVAGTEMTGSGRMQLGTPPDVDLHLESQPAALGELLALLPAAADTVASGSVATSLQVKGPAAVDPPPAVTGTVTLRDVAVHGRKNPSGVEGLSTTISFAGDVATVPSARFRVDGRPAEASGTFRLPERLLTVDHFAVDDQAGRLSGTGRVELEDVARPRFAVDLTARNLDCAVLLAARAPESAQRFSGRLDADASLTGAGSDEKSVRRSLAGTARIDVRDGVLHGVNLVDDVLGGLTGIAGLGDLAPARLRGKRPELFGGSDTRFETIRATARIANQQVRSDDFVLKAPSYGVRGKGTIGFGGDVDVSATLTTGPDLMADLVASVREARFVANEQGLLEVPFRLTGTLPDLHAHPDAGFVARAVQKALVSEGIGLLGSRDKDDGAADGKKPKKKRNVEDRIRKGLESLFGR